MVPRLDKRVIELDPAARLRLLALQPAARRAHWLIAVGEVAVLVALMSGLVWLAVSMLP